MIQAHCLCYSSNMSNDALSCILLSITHNTHGASVNFHLPFRSIVPMVQAYCNPALKLFYFKLKFSASLILFKYCIVLFPRFFVPSGSPSSSHASEPLEIREKKEPCLDMRLKQDVLMMLYTYTLYQHFIIMFDHYYIIDYIHLNGILQETTATFQEGKKSKNCVFSISPLKQLWELFSQMYNKKHVGYKSINGKCS